MFIRRWTEIFVFQLDIKWWRHEMETFSRYWLFVRGIHWSPLNSPHKGQRRRVLMFSLACTWTNGWLNNRDPGDLRRHRASRCRSHHGVCHHRRSYCPACRTTLIATRFRVAVICPIIQVPHCIRVFFYFVWFVFINHIFQFYYELCTYCNILDIYLS